MKAARLGLIATFMMLLTAMWLFFAPFILGYQRQGADWVTATRNDVAVGGGLAVVCLVGSGMVLVLNIRELRRAAQTRRDHSG